MLEPLSRTGLAVFPLLTLAACGVDAERPVDRVLLITCDTLRADRLGAYGYERETSPALDAFAAEGAVFEEAYATAPMTQPSVSSLMTGRLPQHVGVERGNLRRLPSEVVTLAESLRSEGVATAAVISNWVLRRPSAGEGDTGVQQGFDHYDDAMDVREKNRPAFERLARGTTDAAIAYLESHDPAKPLFLWVHYQDPHGPYTPPPKLARQFETATGDEPELRVGKTVLGRGQIPNYQRLDEERRPGVYRDRYDAEILYFDRQLERLFDWLKAADLYDDALMIFTSDHGEALGEHDYWFCHGESLHREIVRVPLIVRAPAVLGAPTGRVASSASLVDVWPTVHEAFGIDPGPTFGRSLLRAHEGPRLTGQSLVPQGHRDRWGAVSDGRWRVIWNDEHPTPRLFDIASDPVEQNDLAAEQPDRVRRMLAEWKDLVERTGGPAVALADEQGVASGDDATEALRFLGYVDGEEEPDE